MSPNCGCDQKSSQCYVPALENILNEVVVVAIRALAVMLSPGDDAIVKENPPITIDDISTCRHPQLSAHGHIADTNAFARMSNITGDGQLSIAENSGDAICPLLLCRHPTVVRVGTVTRLGTQEAQSISRPTR